MNITFETAKLAEQKGYKFEYIGTTLVNIPTQSELQKWLREHNIHIIIWVDDFDFGWEIKYYGEQINLQSITNDNIEFFDTYEEALEAGLFKALNLITK